MRRSRSLHLATAVLLGTATLAGCGSDDAEVIPPVDAPDDGTVDDPGTDDGDGDDPTDGTIDDGADGADGTDDESGGDVDPSEVPEALQSAVATAVDELAADTGADPADVEVVTAEPVTWSDGSKGCPQPDQMYTMALVPGYRIVLAVDGDEVHYHGGDGETPFRCDDPAPPAEAGS